MTKRTTKRALILSAFSLLLCVSMLIGTTFAWFTDSVTSGNNKIVAGNLDIELLDENDNPLGNKSIFDNDFEWEPGAVLLSKNFKVANVGSLALTYIMALEEVTTKPEDGPALTDVIKLAIVPAGTDINDRQAVIDACAWGEIADLSADELCLLPGAKNAYQLALYWAPTVNDNDYNMNNDNHGKELSIEFGLTVRATQAVFEADSFDNSYDIMALKEIGATLYQTSSNTLNALNSTAKAALNLQGRTYLLTGDISNPDYMKLKGTGAFYLNGHDIDGGNATYSLILEGDIVLGGAGTVTNSQGGYGIMVQGTADTKEANVTIGAGVQVDNMYILDGAVVTIKSGAVMRGYINVGNEETHGYAPCKLIIEDGAAVEGVIFQQIDIDLIVIPDGYEWDMNSSWSTGKTDGMTLVKIG